jgi:hypothetical protein
MAGRAAATAAAQAAAAYPVDRATQAAIEDLASLVFAREPAAPRSAAGSA